MLYEMCLVGLAMDPFSNSPIVILKDRASVEAEEQAKKFREENEGEESEALSVSIEEGDIVDSEEHILPIWIGESEANAIATELLGIMPSRPMTHDLLRKVISTMGGELHRVIVSDLRENTFYATIEVETESGEVMAIDCRPSDALALALRFKANIFVDMRVLSKTQQVSEKQSLGGEGDAKKNAWKEALENFSTDSMNKYKQ